MNSSSQPPYDPVDELLRQSLREHPWDFEERDWHKLKKKMEEIEKNHFRDWLQCQVTNFLDMFHFTLSLMSIPAISLM